MLALLLPLTRAIPGIYVWMVRRRLVYWYRQLKALERKLDHGGAKFDAEAMGGIRPHRHAREGHQRAALLFKSAL